MELDPAVCERARLSRDARFDGRFFIAVVTTGIYCRPVCPVRLPRSENVRFMPSAAAAAEAGFRPCLRCRPEASPGTPAWLGTSASVSRALRLIGEGALDSGSVEELAAKLGIGGRHLHRLFLRHLGASPVSVAQTRRLHFAKKLLDETDLPMSQVALAAGFGSVRRFNAVVRATYDRSPSQLRSAAERRRRGSSTADGFRVRLPFRAPFDWDAMIGFLAARAIPGVESVSASRYRRTIRIGGTTGAIEVSPVAGEACLSLRVCMPDSLVLLPVAERVKRMFDLAADPAEICAQLGQHALLADSVALRPGLRVPGAWDPFELAVRAVLGQQVSVRGATTLSGRIVRRFGEACEPAGDAGLTHVFPAPERLAEADLSGIGLTGAREHTLRELARAVCDGRLRLDVGQDLDACVAALCEIAGIGEWTAQYVAMRAFGEPDAFPRGDLVLARAAAGPDAPPLSAGRLARVAEAWRPWRAYAAMHLWASAPAPAKARPARASRKRAAALEARS